MNQVSERSHLLENTEIQILEDEESIKDLRNEILELKGRIRAFVRVRPLLSGEGVNSTIAYPDSGRGIVVKDGELKTYSYTFDRVFPENASQQDVFMDIAELVQSALDGNKVCILAYGQTSSGKTHTMMGRWESAELKGLIPRSLELVFQTISQSPLPEGLHFEIQISMLEIYNENIRDLLDVRSPNDPGKKLEIASVNGEVFVKNLTLAKVSNVEDVRKILKKGAQYRSVASTNMNRASSRSHCVITVNVEKITQEKRVKGVLNLIDLAGTERLSSSGAVGDTMKETQAINKSLSNLSGVISSLVNKDGHARFRDSKLTRLLEPLLRRDSKMLMLLNVSPHADSVNETISTLNFGKMAMSYKIGS